MNLLLVMPPLSPHLKQGGFQRISENLGICYLAAVARCAGHDVRIIDAFLQDLTLPELIDAIRNACPDVLGLSLNYPPAVSKAVRCFEVLRGDLPDAFFVLGGHLATLLHDQLLDRYPFIDIVVRSEAELILPALLDALQGHSELSAVPGITYRDSDQLVATPPPPLIENLDELPFPARDTLPDILGIRPIANVSGSRGCYADCSFCSIRAFFRGREGPKPRRYQWRGRSPANIVNELEALIETYHIKSVYFVDDEFFGPPRTAKERAEEFARLILERKLQLTYSLQCRVDSVDEELFYHLKESGLRFIALGVESGVQRMLNTFRKGTTVERNKQALRVLEKLDLPCCTGFITFDPFTTLEEFEENLSFMEEMPAIEPFKLYSRLRVLPGTCLQRDFLRQGIIREKEFDYLSDYFNFTYSFQDSRVPILLRYLEQAFQWGANTFNAIEQYEWDAAMGMGVERDEAFERKCEQVRATSLKYARETLEFARQFDGRAVDEAQISEFIDEMSSKVHSLSLLLF